jgi:hypothetical protein
MSHAFEVDWQGTKEEGPVFRAGREFGVNEAAELRERLTELGPRVPVRVDLTRTVDLSDHALAELLEWVVEIGTAAGRLRGSQRAPRADAAVPSFPGPRRQLPL